MYWSGVGGEGGSVYYCVLSRWGFGLIGMLNFFSIEVEMWCVSVSSLVLLVLLWLISINVWFGVILVLFLWKFF